MWTVANPLTVPFALERGTLFGDDGIREGEELADFKRGEEVTCERVHPDTALGWEANGRIYKRFAWQWIEWAWPPPPPVSIGSVDK